MEMKKEYTNKEWLIKQVDKYGTISAIARATGYSRGTIAKYIKEFEIELNGYDVSHRKYNFNDRFFENIDTEEKAYWLGFFVADGCMYHHKTSYDIQFTLQETDIDHLNAFAKAIESEKSASIVKQGRNNAAFFRISSKRMYHNLLELGLTSKKTGKEVVPSNIPDHLIRHFIRGYFDGDGCISKYITPKNETYYTFNIVCANEQFLWDISDFISENIGESLNV